MAMGCSDCPICGRPRYKDAAGNCYCKLCGYDAGASTSSASPLGELGSDKSKQGSGVFKDSEIKQGYRKL